MLTNMICCVQDDPANAGLLKMRRALLGCDDERDEDDSDDADEDEDDRENEENRHVHRDSNRGGKSAAVSSRDSSSGPEGSPGQDRVESSRLDKGEEEGEEEEEEDELEKHKHKKHHKKHKKKKHHKKDRQQCRFLEGLTSSVVKFGTSSGDYLAASHGNNTCYQAVSGRITFTVNWRLCFWPSEPACSTSLEPCALSAALNRFS